MPLSDILGEKIEDVNTRYVNSITYWIVPCLREIPLGEISSNDLISLEHRQSIELVFYGNKHQVQLGHQQFLNCLQQF